MFVRVRYDYFMGAWLNPRFASLDLKMLLETRVAWIMLYVSVVRVFVTRHSWTGRTRSSLHLSHEFTARVSVYFSSRFYVTVGAAATQYLASQNITPSMWFMLTAHFLYANACMKVGNWSSVGGWGCLPLCWGSAASAGYLAQ